MLEFLRITLERAVSQSSQQGRPMYYSRAWDCKAAAVRAEGQGGRQSCSSRRCQADVPDLRRQEVSELSRLWSRAGQRSVFPQRASLAAVAANILKDLHRHRHVDILIFFVSFFSFVLLSLLLI